MFVSLPSYSQQIQIYLANMYLLSWLYTTLVGTEDIAVNTVVKNLCPMECAFW